MKKTLLLPICLCALAGCSGDNSTTKADDQPVTSKMAKASAGGSTPPATGPAPSSGGALDKEMPNPHPEMVGKPADFEVAGLDGKPVKLSSMKGKVVLVDFWATWCIPCRKGLVSTQALYDKYKGRNFTVMTVSDEDVAKVKRFIEVKKFTFPTFVDKGDKVEKQFGIDNIPVVLIVDASGNLSDYILGRGEKTDDHILASLQKAGLKS